MNLNTILETAINTGTSDIFLIAGLPVTFKINGVQNRSQEGNLMPEDIERMVNEVYHLAKRTRGNIYKNTDDDFSFAIPHLGRFRINVFRQRGSWAAVIRVIQFGIPDPSKLGITENVLSLTDNKRGMVIVAGTAGCGKTTTLACMIDRINKTREAHIITMEDPIEYLHSHNKSIVTQREIYIDTSGYLESLRSALRESPDVILLGEMRDYEAISAAVTAAETGVLIFSTLHTGSVSTTINRIVDVFPAEQQPQVRGQLSQLIRGIVCQQLVMSKEGGLVPAFEVMKSTPAIQNMIREGKYHQLESVMQSSAQEGMTTMDNSLLSLVQRGVISEETALLASHNYDYMKVRLKEI